MFENKGNIDCSDCLTLLEDNNVGFCEKCSENYKRAIPSSKLCKVCDKFDLEIADEICVPSFSKSYGKEVYHLKCFHVSFLDVIKIYEEGYLSDCVLSSIFGTIHSMKIFFENIEFWVKNEYKLFNNVELLKSGNYDIYFVEQGISTFIDMMKRKLAELEILYQKVDIQDVNSELFNKHNRFFNLRNFPKIAIENKIKFLEDKIDVAKSSIVDYHEIKRLKGLFKSDTLYLKSIESITTNVLDFILKYIPLKNIIIDLIEQNLKDNSIVKLFGQQKESVTFYLEKTNIISTLELIDNLEITCTNLFVFCPKNSSQLMISPIRNNNNNTLVCSLSKFNPRSIYLKNIDILMFVFFLIYFKFEACSVNLLYIDYHSNDNITNNMVNNLNEHTIEKVNEFYLKLSHVTLCSEIKYLARSITSGYHINELSIDFSDLKALPICEFDWKYTQTVDLCILDVFEIIHYHNYTHRSDCLTHILRGFIVISYTLVLKSSTGLDYIINGALHSCTKYLTLKNTTILLDTLTKFIKNCCLMKWLKVMEHSEIEGPIILFPEKCKTNIENVIVNQIKTETLIKLLFNLNINKLTIENVLINADYLRNIKCPKGIFISQIEINTPKQNLKAIEPLLSYFRLNITYDTLTVNEL